VGFHAGDIAWPAPTRIPVGPLANYGYDGQVLLATTLDVTEEVATSTVALRAEAKWLVCNEDECIPGSAPLSLTLPVERTTPRPSEDAPLFAQARARLPLPRPESWRMSASADAETLTLAVSGVADPVDSPPLFFPFDRQVIEHAAPQALERTADGFALRIPRGQSRDRLASLDGVLRLGTRAYAMSVATPEAGGPAFLPLLLAFVGGLLLNVMPCVFPVLAIKAFALLGTNREERREVRAHGVAYTLGVLVSFWALAAVLIAVRAGGAPLGWGFQLQSPAVVAGPST
jgi:thiol:disulfide interchange protein DsbD